MQSRLQLLYMGEHHRTSMPREIAERALELAFARSPAVDVSFFGGEPGGLATISDHCATRTIGRLAPAGDLGSPFA